MNEQLRLVDPETGEVAIQEIQVDPKAQAALFAKLSKVMGKLERLPKSGYNDHFKYFFVTDGDVSDMVRAALASEGVAFFATMRSAHTDGKKVVAQFTYTFADGETGATWSCDWIGEAIDSQDKGTAKAATSALKYFLLKNFVLSSSDPTDDTDGDTPAKAKAKQQKPPAKAKAASNGNEQLKAAFFAKVLAEIPYYEHVNHVTHTLKQLGFTVYTQAKEAEILDALKEHANEAANKEAEAA